MLEKAKVDNSIYKDFGDKWYKAKDCVGLLRHESYVRNAWVLERLKQKYNASQTSILDVGCGGGFLSNELAKANFKVTGLDLHEEALEVARCYDTTKTVEYIQGSAYSLPFEDKTFDVICMMDFLEHVDDVEAVLKESSRVLKKGGLIFFHTFNRNFISWLLAIKCVEWFIAGTPKNLHVHHLFIKPKELLSLFQQIDFEKKEVIGLKPILSPKILMHFLFKREVHKDFTFKRTSSLWTGYSGYCEKN